MSGDPQASWTIEGNRFLGRWTNDPPAARCWLCSFGPGTVTLSALTSILSWEPTRAARR